MLFAYIDYLIFYIIFITPLSKIIWYLNRIIFSCDIDYRADLSGSFVIKHGLGIVIGSSVKSLGVLKVYQGVTLGGSNGKSREFQNTTIWMPYIKPNVTIFTDAKVFGPVVIGSDNIIKAGSIISSDVPDYKK